MGKSIQIIVDGIDNASGVFGGIGKSIKSLGTDAAGAAKGGLSSLTSLLGTGLKVAAGGAAAGLGLLGAGLYSSVGAAEDLQQEIADVSASMGASADETKRLKDLILKLGMDSKLKVDATEAAEAIGNLGTAGLDVDQIMAGAARSTVLLSNATGADFAKSADVATDVMSLFNIEAKDLQGAVNSITGVTMASKLKFDDYALALGSGAKGAKAANLDFEQFNTLLTATASNFTSGMTQGTGLTAMLLGLHPSTKKASELMQDLGIITEDGRNRFFDLNGEVVSNNEISNVLRDTLGKLNTEQRLAAVNTLFGRDALGAVNGMISTTSDQWADYTAKLTNTDAEQQAAMRMDTLKGSVEILGGTIDTIKIKIGDKLLPVLQAMATKFSDFLSMHADQLVEWADVFAVNLEALVNWLLVVVEDGDTMNDWLEHMNPTLADTVLNVVDFVVGVKSVVGPIKDFIDNTIGLKGVLMILGGIIALGPIIQIASLVATVISAVSGFISLFGAVSSVLPAFGAVVVAITPVGLAIGAVVAVVAGLYLAWKNNWFGIRDITSNVVGAVKGFFTDMINSTNLTGLRDKVVSSLDSYKAGFTTAAGNLVGALKAGIAKFASDPVASMNAVLDGIAGTLSDAARGGGLKGSLATLGLGLVTSLKDGINKVANDPVGAFNAVVDRLSSFSQSTLAAGSPFAAKMFGHGKQAVASLFDGVSSLRDSGGDYMAYAISGVIDWVNRNFDSGGAVVVHLLTKGREAGENLMQGMEEGIMALWGGVKDTVRAVAQSMIDAVADVFGAHSPATEFKKLSNYAMQGLDLGVKEMQGVPAAAMSGAASRMIGAAAASITNSRVNNFNVTLPGQQSGTVDGTVYNLVNTLTAVYG